MAVGRMAGFLDNVRESQVVEPATYEQIVQQARGEDPTALAKDLVARNLFTPYQINQILRGQGKGLTLGPYRLMDRVGEGGMGQVFKAYHKPLHRTVALKVIRKEKLANPVAVKRFYQEVKAQGSLSHPNIVAAFDAGQVGDTHFFAMEFVDGVDLSKLVKEQGARPVAEACDYIRQAALGLQQAHERGMVHRDIKPHNLLVGKPGTAGAGVVKILDMGLARVTTDQGEEALTKMGTVIGTPDYLAPEQAVNSHAADIRSDLYSLGCTFYYLLSGFVPFRASSLPEVLLKHQTETPAPLETYRGDLPPGLQAVVGKLMAKRPDDRYQTPGELAQALLAFTRKKGAAPATSSAIAKGPRAESRKVSKGPVIASRSGRRKGKRPVAMMMAIGLVFVIGLLAGAAVLFPELNPLNQSNTASKAEVVQATTPTPPEPPPIVETKKDPDPKTETKKDPDPKIETKKDPDPKVETKKDPDPKTETKKDPDPKTSTKPPEPKKDPVPPNAKVAEAEKLIREAYKADYSKKKPAEMLLLAAKLLDEASKTVDDKTARYALYREAADLAAKAGDYMMVLKVLDEIGQRYAIDATDLKIQALAAAVQVTQLPAVMRSITDAALELVGDAVDEDKYKVAQRLLEIADAASRKSNSAATLAKVQTTAKEVAEIAKAYEAARSAAATLDKTADDPDASSKWGRFIALLKGHWGKGLPLLAQGSDEKMKALAQMDLSNPEDPALKLEIGDAWWKLAQESSGIAKKQLYLRAKHWYEQVASKLVGFTKTRVAENLQAIDKLFPKEEPTTGPISTVPTLDPVKLAFDRQLAMGANQLRLGNYGLAVEAYSEALRLKPEEARAMAGLKEAKYQDSMARGNRFFFYRQYKEAMKEFEVALEQKPGDVLATTGLNEARKKSFQFNKN